MPASEVLATTSSTSPAPVRFGNSTTAAGTSYLAPGHMEAVSDGTERVWTAPCAGTLRALYAHTSAAHGVGGQTVALTVRKNGAGTTLTVSFTNVDTDKSDVAHTATFVAGDRLSVECVCSGGGAVLANVSASISYTSA